MLRLPRAGLLLAGLGLACGDAPPATSPEPTPRPTLAAERTPAAAAPRPRAVGELEARAVRRPPVMFVGLDGADWQQLEPLLAAGALPNLARLRAASAWGVLESEIPMLSPLLWTSMMTGLSPLEHGILDFSRFRPGSGAGAGLREPVTSDERRAPAIWNLATWAGQRADVLGLWATYPAEPVDGVLVSDRLFGFLNVEDRPPPGAIYPPEREAWARERLAALWRDTDHAQLAAYLPGLPEAEFRAHAESERPYEHPVSALRRILVETRLYGALAESLLAEAEGPPELFVLYLQGTDSIGHVFAPYAPPRQPGIEAAEFERYRGVAERYFREVDELLGRLVAAADRSGAAIVLASDHGFLWGEGRPDKLSSFANATAARWHRADGIWLVRAPAVTPGRGAAGGLRQVFPTLVSLLGLPGAAGGEVRPLAGLAPASGPPFDYRALFDHLAARRQPSTESAGDDRAAAEELAKLQALGYLGAGEATSAPAAARATGSTRTAGSLNNEGILLRGERRDGEARAAFERALELDPDLASALWNLSDLLHAARELERSDELLVRSVARGLPEGTRYLIGRAIGYQRSGELARSVALLDRAVEARPEERELWLFRGRFRVEARDCRGAVGDFGRAAALAPGDPAVHASAALAHLCAGDRAAARAAFRRSLELDPEQPRLRAMLAEIGGPP